MTELHFPWLMLAVLTPLVGALCVRRVREVDVARRWCLAFTAATFAVAVGAALDFVRLDVPIAHDRWDLLAHLRGGEVWMIDELSTPLLPLTALLFLLTVVVTLPSKMRRFPFSSVLVLEAIMLATLACRAPWGVIALLALGTLPPVWELRGRKRSVRVYAAHMGLFVAMMVLGRVIVESEGPANVHSLWAVAPLLIAVLVRSGIAPFHCWVTDLFEHATFGTSLIFVAPMLGAYAAVRLLLPIAPDEVLRTMGILALATALYASGMALVQREARRFFCYVFLSHSALVMVGLDTLSSIGLTGGLCVWLSIGLSLAGFGLTLRALESRHGRLSLTRYHGVYEHTPILAICFMLTGMASVGFPGTFGFLGNELLVDGAVQTYPYIGITVVLASAINGIAVVQAYFRLFTGARHVSSMPLTVRRRERFAVLALAAMIFGFGMFPQPVVESRHHAANEILAHRESHTLEPGPVMSGWPFPSPEAQVAIESP